MALFFLENEGWLPTPYVIEDGFEDLKPRFKDILKSIYSLAISNMNTMYLEHIFLHFTLRLLLDHPPSHLLPNCVSSTS